MNPDRIPPTTVGTSTAGTAAAGPASVGLAAPGTAPSGPTAASATGTRPARRRRRPAAVAAGALVAAAALVLLPALPASAHVHVVPEDTAAGGWTTLTFRVPNESATAGTTEVAVDLPTDTPLTSVSTRPVPGWTATVETGTLPEPVEVDGATLTQAPVRVVWTADAGSEITDGEYQEFAISVGPLPAEGTTLVLPTTQTYSDGTEVVWDEVSTDGTEPDNPAPTFTITAAEDDSEESGTADDQATDDPSAESVSISAAGTDAADDTTARVLGGAGLVLGAAALAVALLRRRSGDADPEQRG
ncbi:MAG TPA: YcnI family protein [Cellulomonas sp.]